MGKNDRWKLSRRRGWLKSTNTEQSVEWRSYCFRNGLDCIEISEEDEQFSLSCLVHPERSLSQLGYMELNDYLREKEFGGWSMGREFRSNCSQFEFTFPLSEDPQELVDNIKAILRRDSTSQRAAELTASRAPLEGMALALTPEGLWENHDPSEAVYILETAVGSGRCVVLKHRHLPLTDMPLEQFRLLADCDL